LDKRKYCLVNEQDAMKEQSSLSYSVDQYFENSQTVLCPHAQALLTVLRRKRNSPSMTIKQDEYFGTWKHTFVTDV
jgi:hypothetical protein